MDMFKTMLGKHNHHSRKHHGHHSGWRDYDRLRDRRYSSHLDHGRSGHLHRDMDAFESHMHPLLRQLMGNKKIVGLFLLVAAVLLVLAVGALVSLVPMLLKLVGLAGEDGLLASVLEQAKPLVDTLKLGTAK